MTVAIGYVRIGTDHIEKDPDRRIVEALTLVFAKFTEMQSVRQVHLWLRHERVSLPAVTYGAEGRRVEWKLPVYNTILHILTNRSTLAPMSSGAPAVASASRQAARRWCAASRRSARTGRC